MKNRAITPIKKSAFDSRNAAFPMVFTFFIENYRKL